MGRHSRPEKEKLPLGDHYDEPGPLKAQARVLALYLNPRQRALTSIWGLSLATARVFTYQRKTPGAGTIGWQVWCLAAGSLWMPKNATILLVEDNADDVLLIQRSFKKLSLRAQVVTAPDGEEAMRYLYRELGRPEEDQRVLPKLILLDLYMPRMDGFQFLTWLRQRSEFRHLPVIILTGSAFSPDVKQAYTLGANSFLVKPNDLSELTAALKEVIDFWLHRTVASQSNPSISPPNNCSDEPPDRQQIVA